MVNSTLSQNTADMGGGVANSGKLRLINTTVTRNEATAGVGGGVQNGQIGTVGGELTLQRALIAGNTASGLRRAGPFQWRPVASQRQQPQPLWRVGRGRGGGLHAGRQ